MIFSNLRDDIRHAARFLRKTPGFTFAAVTALALGIGANTAVFSVVNAVLLKPLPFPDPSRLVFLGTTSPEGPNIGMSPARFEFMRRDTATLRDVAAFLTGSMNYTGGDIPVQVHSQQVSTGFFRLFGLHMLLGRPFTPQEDVPGAGNVVVLGKGMWEELFDSDPSIVGDMISLGDKPYTVVGVLEDFSFEDFGGVPDVIVPFQFDPNTDAQGNYILAAARLKPGVTLAQASSEIAGSTAAFNERFPEVLGPSVRLDVVQMQEELVASARRLLYVLVGAVALVLLIACANVANLLLVHATGRKREIAIRTALGASRVRIARQLLTESLLLGLAGGVLGCIAGVVGIRSLLALGTMGLPRLGVHGADVALDERVLAFTLGVSLLTAMVFGLLPSLGAVRADVAVAFNEGSARASSGIGHNRTRAAFVVTEIILALALLVGSGLLIRTQVALGDVDPGFDPHNVLILHTSLSGQRFATTAAVAQTITDAVQQVEAVAGVERASAAPWVPLRGGYTLPFTIAQRPVGDAREQSLAGWDPVSPGYFEVLKIALLRGRTFTENDDADGTPVVIINEALAKKYWPSGGALGAEITVGHGVSDAWEGEPARRIVGVVADTRNRRLNDRPEPRLYEPQAQVPDAVNEYLSNLPLAWIVRTGTPSLGLTKSIQTVIQQASGLPTSGISSMEQVIQLSTSRQRFNMWLMTVFGGSALLLAAIGIYGLMAYTVEQRTSEIGIRLALGAEPAKVAGMVVWQGMRLVLVGVVLGIAAALALSRLIAGFLYGVEAWDPLVFVSVPLVLTAVALLAVWWPGRRMSRVDPSLALRSE